MPRFIPVVGFLLCTLPFLASANMNASEGHHLAVMALQHDTKAYLRLDVAAHRGDAVAMNWLGAYWESRGDAVRARKDYLSASAAGNGTAALNLGYLYRYGHGVPKNMVRAIVWYRRAAHLGNAHALAELGNAYYLGQGVRRDRVRAYLWYWLATRRSAKWRPVLDALSKEMGPLQVNRARDAARAWLAGEARP